jgi:hypothetical protein
MSNLVTIRLVPFEALILASMLKEASTQLMQQVAELDENERFFLATIQRMQKLFSEVPE